MSNVSQPRLITIAFALAALSYGQTERGGIPASRTGGEAITMNGGILVTAARIEEMLRAAHREQVFEDTSACDDNITPECLGTSAGSAVPNLFELPDHLPCMGQVIPPAPNQSPAPIASFEANLENPPGKAPQDPQIAASTTQVLVTFNTKLAWYTKAGTRQGELYAADLFQPLFQKMSGLQNPCDNNSSVRYCAQDDMRAIFDPWRKRFWVLGTGGIYLPNQPVRGIAVLAVSLTEDPKDGWYEYWWDLVAGWNNPAGGVYQNGDGSDYPAISVDAFGFHQTNKVGRYVNNKPTYRYWAVRVFRASKPVNGIPADGWTWWDLGYPDGSTSYGIQPVMHHTAVPNNGAYYVAVQGTANAAVWHLTDPLTPQQQMVVAGVPIKPLTPPRVAPQLGVQYPIDTTNLGNGVLKAVYRSGQLYLTMNDAADWFGDKKPLSSVRLVRLDMALYPHMLATIDRTFGKNGSSDVVNARVHYAWPAVEVNSSLDMVVVYARSGACIHPEVRYSVFYGNESDIRPSYLLKNGESPFIAAGPDQAGALRWGDLAGASVEPKDDVGIWVAHQYATTGGLSSIWVGKVLGRPYIDFVPGPEVTIEPRVVPDGQQVELEGSMRNDGDATAELTPFAVYLSKPDQRDILLVESSVTGSLPPGYETRFRVRTTIPSDTPPGTYSLKLVLDPHGQFDEYSKTNNTALGTEPVEIVAR